MQQSLLMGMAVGTWAATKHFRPLLDYKEDLATQCAAARGNLAGLAQAPGQSPGRPNPGCTGLPGQGGAGSRRGEG